MSFADPTAIQTATGQLQETIYQAMGVDTTKDTEVGLTVVPESAPNSISRDVAENCLTGFQAVSASLRALKVDPARYGVRSATDFLREEGVGYVVNLVLLNKGSDSYGLLKELVPDVKNDEAKWRVRATKWDFERFSGLIEDQGPGLMAGVSMGGDVRGCSSHEFGKAPDGPWFDKNAKRLRFYARGERRAHTMVAIGCYVRDGKLYVIVQNTWTRHFISFLMDSLDWRSAAFYFAPPGCDKLLRLTPNEPCHAEYREEIEEAGRGFLGHFWTRSQAATEVPPGRVHVFHCLLVKSRCSSACATSESVSRLSLPPCVASPVLDR
jgi:hypothetical protein